MLSINKTCSTSQDILDLVNHGETLQLGDDEILYLVMFYIDFPGIQGLPVVPPEVVQLKDRYKNHRRNIVASVLSSVEFNFRGFSTYYLCTYCGKKVDDNLEMTLDHFRPKHSHPEYAVFTKNLIPTCNPCNTIHKKNNMNSVAIDMPYPVIGNIIPAKIDIKLQLDIDQVASDPVTKYLHFNLTPKIVDPLMSNMIKELKLEARVSKKIMAKKYRLLKKLRIIPQNNQVAELNADKKEYLEDEGDIPMHLLADCLARQVNLDYVRQHNYFL